MKKDIAIIGFLALILLSGAILFKNYSKPGEGPIVKPAECYIGGCSGQLCTDRSDIASTCEYREAYACYKTAKCERQTSGACGWTQTPELKMCFQNAN